MISTLEQLQEHTSKHRKRRKRKKIAKEIQLFVIVFVCTYIVYTLTVNAELFVQALSAEGTQTVLTDVYTTQSSIDTQTKHIQRTQSDVSPSAIKNKFDIQSLEQTLAKHTPTAVSDLDASIHVESSLKQNLNSYHMEFNRLPPTNRLIIPAIGVDVPLLNPSYDKPIDQLTTDDFDAELYNGVIKYPTTPPPNTDNTDAHTMIFGHTSYEFYRSNPYGTVLKDIPKLQVGDEIKTVWNGQMQIYRVVEKKVIRPQQIPQVYEQYSDGHHLSLIGCYPIGTTTNRIVIVTEKVQ